MSELEIEQQSKTNAEDKMSTIAKAYKLSLTQIEVVKIEDKEYFKFYDPETDSIKMLENSDDKDLNEQFEAAQQSLSFSQNEDGLQNAKNIFDFEGKYNRKAISLISVKALENNLLSYRYILDNVDKETLDAFKFLLTNREVLKLQYINIEKSIAIDEDQNVLFTYFDPELKRFNIRKAEIEKYEDKKVQVDADGYNLELSGIDYDEVIEAIDIENPEEMPIEIAGEEIAVDELNTIYQYPELLDRMKEQNMMSKKKATIMAYLIEAYKRKLAKKQAMKNPDKRLALKLDDQNKAAYVNALVLMLISAFAAGILFTISFIYIRMHL